MDAMFIRHKFNCTKETLEELKELWSKRLIAVHFNDKWSTNPEDYVDQGKKALTLLWKYCESGAIVGADFKDIHPTSMLVGEIKPGSKIISQKFGKYVYKTVQLKNTKEISYLDYNFLLREIQPRGTINGWPSAQKYLKAILRDALIPWKVGSLDTNQLEVICYEYLRKRKILVCLLMPIGRTMQDVDIHGINERGKHILAQVTHEDDSKKISEKIEKLKVYKSKGSIIIFFGPKSKKTNDCDVEYIPIEDVFDDLTSDKKSVHYKMISKMLGRKRC